MIEHYGFIRDFGIVLLLAAAAGWLCRWAKFSPVFGYLVAGIIAGPYALSTSLLENPKQIQTLANLGLIFVMFALGLRLSFRKLRALGWGVPLATVIGALITFQLARWLGLALGFRAGEGIFFAGIVVVSSSAVVAKTLLETGRLHSRSGQTAAAITVLEDLVAVVVVALLNSYVQMGPGGETHFGEEIGMLGAFVTLLGILGLLFLPKLLKRLGARGQEIEMLLVAGLLLVLAFLAQRAGYSLALGSFLLGAVVAETAGRDRIERSFSGLRDLFSAVFFVAAGMVIDVRLFGSVWYLSVLGALFVIVIRPVAFGFGLMVTGNSPRAAAETAALLVPLGEFSFIIAQLGVASKVVPGWFQPMTVGMALMTSLAAPLMAARSVRLGEWVEQRHEGFLGKLVNEYHRWLQRIQDLQAASVLWQVSKKRLAQVAIGMLLTTGLLVFVPPFERSMMDILGLDAVAPISRIIFWAGLSVIVASLVVAIWRNLDALAMIFAEVTTEGLSRGAEFRPVIQTGLQVIAGVALFFWLMTILPLRPVALLFVAAVAAVLVTLLWRKLVYWHSEMESRLKDAFTVTSNERPMWAARSKDWKLETSEVSLPSEAAAAGKTLSELELATRFSCLVLAIERRGTTITHLDAETQLFAEDRLLLLGSAQDLSRCSQALAVEATTPANGSLLSDLIMGSVRVPPHSLRLGTRLGEVDAMFPKGAQVVAIRRAGNSKVKPDLSETLAASDELLVVGTPEQITAFRHWLLV